MSLETLILYGSGAREDGNERSDCDLFALTDDSHHSMVVKNNVNVAIYPFPQAMEMAKNGDLFVMHIVHEGRLLYDHKGYHPMLVAEFQFRNCYKVQIAHGSDLGWILLKIVDRIQNYTLLNKRVAWCVRTILIAKTAQARSPVFSAKSLAKTFRNDEILELIENKSSDTLDYSILRKFSTFLTLFGTTAPSISDDADISDIAEFFRGSANIVGTQTLQQLSSDMLDISY